MREKVLKRLVHQKDANLETPERGSPGGHTRRPAQCSALLPGRASRLAAQPCGTRPSGRSAGPWEGSTQDSAYRKFWNVTAVSHKPALSLGPHVLSRGQTSALL